VKFSHSQVELDVARFRDGGSRWYISPDEIILTSEETRSLISYLKTPDLDAETGLEAKITAAAEVLHALAPTKEGVRELLLFLLAGALDGLTPNEVTVQLMRITRMLDGG
jgi:hypothetical protein